MMHSKLLITHAVLRSLTHYWQNAWLILLRQWALVVCLCLPVIWLVGTTYRVSGASVLEIEEPLHLLMLVLVILVSAATLWLSILQVTYCLSSWWFQSLLLSHHLGCSSEMFAMSDNKLPIQKWQPFHLPRESPVFGFKMWHSALQSHSLAFYMSFVWWPAAGWAWLTSEIVCVGCEKCHWWLHNACLGDRERRKRWVCSNCWHASR